MKSLIALFATALIVEPVFAADVISPVSKRFADKSDEVPDFQKHIVPLLGRLGCNGRACHGSFKGQGGFQLSLFGYDFKKDHEQIAGDDFSRIDVDTPEYSMLLSKPTLEEPHGGGKRLDVDSWQHALLRRWIESGAKAQTNESLKLIQLDVSPKELQFASQGEQVPLQAVAVWSDGTREEVTDLCRFQTNDPAVAEVDEKGVITSGQPGDTHVVVFYDGGVVPVPVIRPLSENYGPRYPSIATSTKIDELIGEKLKKLGIVPSEVCSDEEFLRRVSLDVAATLPPAWQVEAFVADSSPDKRERLVDELLETPAYAAWWATRLSDWTGNNPDFANLEIGRDQVAKDWYDWIEKRVADNTPYDELAAGIILSTSREGDESFREYCENMRDVYAEDGDAKFADREMMPHYWARTNFRKAEDRAIGFAYSFMGIRIQCAQCHKHPFDQWTQDDFQNFEAFFTRVNYGIDRESKDEYDTMIGDLAEGKTGNQLRNQLGKMIREGEVVPLREVYVLPPRNNNRRANGKKNENRNEPADAGRVLGGETIDLSEYQDPRQPLVDWLRSTDNPYFARAFVNRVWANYFNVGIVDPPDDLSLANPPSNKALLDYLTEEFVAHDFDMKWLHREITMSDAYQRSWQPNETNRQDEKNFSRAVHRRLPAEVAYDAIALATASDQKVKQLLSDPTLRAIGVPGSGARYRARIGRNDASFALTVFGRDVRESNCECDRSTESSLLQTVYLQNDGEVLRQLDGSQESWIGALRANLERSGRAGMAKNKREAEPDAERVDVLREKIKSAAREAAQLRREGKTKEAKEIVARVAALRQRLFDAEREDGSRSDRKSSEQETSQVASAEVIVPSSRDEIVKQAYLRTLSRYPTADEMRAAAEYVATNENTVDGYRDLLWALLNTKEFIVNH